MRTLVCLFYILILAAPMGAWAQDYGSGQDSTRASGNEFLSGTPIPYGWVPGYTDDVDDEVGGEPKEMVLMQKPTFLMGPELHDKIFNNQLTNEFLFRYQQTFGFTEQEDNYFMTTQEGYYNSPSGLTATQQDQQRAQFASYMVRRLLEFHTDNIMKTDPQLKQIYQIKESVSNIKMEVGPSTKFDMTYSFVGNFLQGKVTNPFATTYVTVNMDPSSVVPSTPQEVYVMAQKQLTTTISGQTGYTFYGHAVTAVLAKALAPAMSVNISESYHMSPSEINGSDEGLTMLGFNLVF